MVATAACPPPRGLAAAGESLPRRLVFLTRRARRVWRPRTAIALEPRAARVDGGETRRQAATKSTRGLPPDLAATCDAGLPAGARVRSLSARVVVVWGACV